MKLSVRRVAAIGIGAVLFFLLGRFVVIPSPIATAAFGGLLGVLANVVRLKGARWNQETLIRFNLCQVAVHVICWAGIAPVLEIALYGENMDRIFEQGLTAAVSSATTTAVVGTVLLLAHAALKSRSAAR